MAASMKSGVVFDNEAVISPLRNIYSERVMDCFWKLAEPNDFTRENAVLTLIAELKKDQATCQLEETSTLLSYTVERLIKGLQSPRKAARLGFSVALVQVLRSFPESVHPNEVFKLIENVTVASSTTQDENNNFVGAIMACVALIRSGRLAEDVDLLCRICNDFITFILQKPAFQELCATLLIPLFSQTEEAVFQKYIWPNLCIYFTCGWEVATPDLLWIMMSLTHHYKNTVDKHFLKKYWGGKSVLLHLHNMDAICHILLDSTKVHPRVHPVCKAVIEAVLVSDDFPVFWRSFVKVVTTKQTKEKLYLLFELMKEVIQNLKEPTLVKHFFLQSIMENFLKNLAHEEMLLHAAAVDLLQVLKNAVIASNDGHFQFAVVESLLRKPSSLMFDQITRTKTISSIVPHFQAEAIASWILYLRNIFNGCPEADETHRAAAMKHLAHLFGHRNIKNRPIWTGLLQFFALHAFFVQLSSSPKVPQCSEKPKEVTHYLRDVASCCFYKCAATLPKCDATGSSVLQIHCSVLSDVLKYIELLLHKPKIVAPLIPWNEMMQKTLKDILQVLIKLQQQEGNDLASSNKSWAFQLLFIHLGFELFGNAKHVSKNFQELTVCCEKAMGKYRSENEPNWIEVIVDLLLSFLSDNNQQTRLIANNVFTLMVPHLTSNALRQILNVIDPSKIYDDENPILDEVNDEVDEVNTNDCSNNEEEVDDDDEENSEASETLKMSLKAALGDAAANSENDDETNLDDEAMMRVDDSLTEVFRSMIKKKTSLSKHEEALLHFRNRCLDFLTIVTNTQPSASFSLLSLIPVIEAIELGLREKNQESLMKKATACLQHVIRITKFHHDQMANVEPAEILSAVVKKYRSVSDSSLTQLLSGTCVFILKCALHYDETSISRKTPQNQAVSSYVEKCMSVFRENLQSFFVKRDCHIPAQLFFTLFLKYTNLSWEFSDALLQYAFDVNVRLFKRLAIVLQMKSARNEMVQCVQSVYEKSQALALLIILTSGHWRLQKIISRNSWKSFSTTFLQGAVKAINSMTSTDMKQKHLENILQLTCTVISLSLKMQTEITEVAAVKSGVLDLRSQQKLSQVCKTCINRICTLLGQSPKPREKRKAIKDKKTKKKLKSSSVV